ncbi:unnamed protein product [Caenorhabditis brenneri]
MGAASRILQFVNDHWNCNPKKMCLEDKEVRAAKAILEILNSADEGDYDIKSEEFFTEFEEDNRDLGKILDSSGSTFDFGFGDRGRERKRGNNKKYELKKKYGLANSSLPGQETHHCQEKTRRMNEGTNDNDVSPQKWAVRCNGQSQSNHQNSLPLGTQMSIPQILNGFLQFCIKHEYSERNSIFQEHNNISEMIESGLTRNPQLQFLVLKPEFDKPPESSDLPKCEPVAKKFRIDFGSTSAKPPEGPDSDSDDNETIHWGKNSEDMEDDYKQCAM